uniref:DDE Tnp4 domain-containing protein n=1 Tax=Clastoptera arizonana TaxID=38151 RepID=A0A1B6E0R6_9HEMI
MASLHVNSVLIQFVGVIVVWAQNGQYNNQEQPSPGDVNYKTYVYNSRRYGESIPQNFNPRQPNINPNSYDPDINRGMPPGYPNNPADDQNYRYYNQDPNAPRVVLPGVLGSWRTDLQGKQRADWQSLDRSNIFVQTGYGQVQGFKVYLYDNPDPLSGYRPGKQVERVTGSVSTFLGIPYALPPVKEGRFRPPRPHHGWQVIQAVDFGPACPQPIRFTGATKGIRDMDEDCLYLNVYSPTFPRTKEDWLEIAAGFENKWQFPHCLGAIDGKHVRIIPPKGSGSYFYNYKKSYSVVLMAIANANCEFVYCDVGTNGRVSDGGVIINTRFHEKLLTNSLNIPGPRPLPNSKTVLDHVFVGDEAFVMHNYIIKPYPRETLDKDQ